MSESSLDPAVVLIIGLILALIFFVIRPAMRARRAKGRTHPPAADASSGQSSTPPIHQHRRGENDQQDGGRDAGGDHGGNDAGGDGGGD